MQLLRGDYRINESTHFITEFNVAVVGLSQCGSPTAPSPYTTITKNPGGNILQHLGTSRNRRIITNTFIIMNTVEVIVEHAGKNLSAYIKGVPIVTVGNDLSEIEHNMREAIDLYLEDNPEPCEILTGEYELKFRLDTATFINYYSGIFTKAALSRITGINERQLWHYAAGVHKPRRKQAEKIQQGITSLTKELEAVILI